MSIPISQVPSPAYVLDEALLRKNLELMHLVQQEAEVDIILAFKGFAMWRAFPMIRKYLKGATASSLYEARLCFEEMDTPAHSYCVAYPPKEFEQILAYSSHITFNSLTQFARFAPVVHASDNKVSCGLRVNPRFSTVKTALYNPAAPDSRLGVTVEHLADGLPEGIEGLHLHVLCESSAEDLVQVLKHFEDQFSPYFSRLKWINLGGGHLMTREGYEVELLIQTLRDFKARTGLHLILEPGSAVAWETGVLISTVLDIVENTGVQTAILDTSFTAHMPDTLEMPYRPNVRDTLVKATKNSYAYRLGGLSCLAGDFMYEYHFSEPLKIGDRIVFEDMMHYTLVKTNMFNGVQHPHIAIWRESQDLEVVRSFVYEDYKHRMA